VVLALQHVRTDLVRVPPQAHESWRGAWRGTWRGEARVVRPIARGLWQGRGLVCPPALVTGSGLSRGMCPDPRGPGVAGRHRIIPADRFGAIRAAVPAASRLELRVDSGDGGEVP